MLKDNKHNPAQLNLGFDNFKINIANKTSEIIDFKHHLENRKQTTRLRVEENIHQIIIDYAKKLNW